VKGGEAVGEVRHVFTHFELRLSVMSLTLDEAPSGFDWMPADEAGDAFPSVFRKALKLAR
jgi:A/G-specific adenine glycosylase